ncbi:hypothetical protein CALVIDRAFT_528840 [Calocera viscosa TUFC12733]|uniref:Uncharacterized protein n=1 Tax=Calocera viscosa (strain TUFC12733) TaxID=1330018 RepID=A0A167K7D1_CALVF|nr:hypothetical protein CALVIDRAFT_528840 [Calocera viscosa TUFC12733]
MTSDIPLYIWHDIFLALDGLQRQLDEGRRPFLGGDDGLDIMLVPFNDKHKDTYYFLNELPLHQSQQNCILTDDGADPGSVILEGLTERPQVSLDDVLSVAHGDLFLGLFQHLGKPPPVNLTEPGQNDCATWLSKSRLIWDLAHETSKALDLESWSGGLLWKLLQHGVFARDVIWSYGVDASTTILRRHYLPLCVWKFVMGQNPPGRETLLSSSDSESLAPWWHSWSNDEKQHLARLLAIAFGKSLLRTVKPRITLRPGASTESASLYIHCQSNVWIHFLMQSYLHGVQPSEEMTLNNAHDALLKCDASQRTQKVLQIACQEMGVFFASFHPMAFEDSPVKLQTAVRNLLDLLYERANTQAQIWPFLPDVSRIPASWRHHLSQASYPLHAHQEDIKNQLQQAIEALSLCSLTTSKGLELTATGGTGRIVHFSTTVSYRNTEADTEEQVSVEEVGEESDKRLTTARARRDSSEPNLTSMLDNGDRRNNETEEDSRDAGGVDGATTFSIDDEPPLLADDGTMISVDGELPFSVDDERSPSVDDELPTSGDDEPPRPFTLTAHRAVEVLEDPRRSQWPQLFARKQYKELVSFSLPKLQWDKTIRSWNASLGDLGWHDIQPHTINWKEFLPRTLLTIGFVTVVWKDGKSITIAIGPYRCQTCQGRQEKTVIKSAWWEICWFYWGQKCYPCFLLDTPCWYRNRSYGNIPPAVFCHPNRPVPKRDFMEHTELYKRMVPGLPIDTRAEPRPPLGRTEEASLSLARGKEAASKPNDENETGGKGRPKKGLPAKRIGSRRKDTRTTGDAERQQQQNQKSQTGGKRKRGAG